MKKRKYTHIKELLPEIKGMLAAGKSQREIEQHLELTGDRPIHNLLKQERRWQRKAEAGIPRRPQGRQCKNNTPRDVLAVKAYEIQRLKMENQLPRDFLRFNGSEA